MSRLTSKGRAVLKEMEEQLKANKPVTNHIKRILIKYCFVKTKDLLDKIYDMLWPYQGREVPIRDIPKGVILLRKLPEDSADTTINMDDDWWATLESLIDVDYAERVERAHVAAREGRMRKFELTTI